MTSASTEEDTAFDPFAYPEEVPIDELAELRSECPVARTPTGWYLTKFDHVLAATRDVETFVSSFRDPGVVVPEEESLRIDSPAHMLIRDCTADTDVFGAPMSRGDKIVFGVSSANRDEDYFDDPDEFRLDRERPKDHIAFGGGPTSAPEPAWPASRAGWPWRCSWSGWQPRSWPPAASARRPRCSGPMDPTALTRS